MTFTGTRLIPGFFRRRDTTEPSTGRVDVRAIDHRNNCMWFSVDTATGQAAAVSFQDAHTNAVLSVQEQIRPGEAVLVVSETAWLELESAHRDATVGTLNDLDFRLPLADVAQVAHLLITAERVHVFDGGPSRDPHPRIERLTRRIDFLALLG